MSGRLAIAVLVSGTGTNLQALLDTVHGREADVVAVASSTAEAQALARARAREVPCAVFARSQYA
ncbi:MAG: phosphoribosylglycinamide formyltransferase, partial [Actinobacteria bacterium]